MKNIMKKMLIGFVLSLILAPAYALATGTVGCGVTCADRTLPGTETSSSVIVAPVNSGQDDPDQDLLNLKQESAEVKETAKPEKK